MTFNRRQFLTFLGVGAGAAAASSLVKFPLVGGTNAASAATLPFPQLFGAMPLMNDGFEGDDAQISAYSNFTVADDLVLPEGYTYDTIAAWGDEVGDSRFGYNNDYLSYVETGPDEGFLTINFEYVSGDTWMATYSPVIGGSLPFAEVQAALESSEGETDAYSLSDDDPLKQQISAIAKEALTDLGVGVISIKRNGQGQWERTFSNADRRINGISGLDNPARLLKATGPATAVFAKSNKKGYDDGFGDKIVGTFQNCAGGTTPWGTALSAEENFQSQVPEPVMADGSSFDPSERTFAIANDMNGSGSVMGLAGNKYGWMVEVDPSNPNDYGTKHTWLGRYRHEAVAVRADAGKPLAVYSGCDRRGGHLYKFVSKDSVQSPTDKANSRLMADGALYAAKFNANGTGEWIALTPDTAVNPIRPSEVFGRDGSSHVILPLRPEGGTVKVEADADVNAFASQYATLGDLYEGTDLEKQGAILIDAHYAATAAGATTTARPEDTDLDANGNLFVAFTSGSPGGDGGPDKAVFGKDGQPWEYGWIFKVTEDANEPAAMQFTWEKFAVGGEPAEGGLGFANPDNLEFDSAGDLWMVTDMSTSRHNKAVPAGRIDDEGKPISQSSLRGLFGNNSVWYMPTSGDRAGEAFLFAFGPMESEMTGPFITRDNRTLFLAAQHPGERNGIRQNMASEAREFEMRTTSGNAFLQTREVPLGSNWPSKTENDPPRPAVVAVRRVNNQPLV
ncbi:MAG: alkaline phosphatase PhoX [Cyanobacteria bacterium J06639_1]